MDGLRARADLRWRAPTAGGKSCAPRGTQPAAGWRPMLADRGDLDGLRARADAGDGYAAWRLARLLAERG